MKIACEISVTTTKEWEIQNVQKCLSAGYETVIVCSTEKKHLENISKLVEQAVSKEDQSKILTLEPENLFLYLDQSIAKGEGTEKRIKGYRVKVEYNALPENVANSKREHILKTVTDAIRKKKSD